MSGAVAFDGKEAVSGLRVMMVLNGLRLEIKIPGMRLTRKAPKCSTIVRREWGFKGKPPALLSQLEAWCAEHMPTVQTSNGPIATVHSNPMPVMSEPLMAYVQTDGSLSETPVGDRDDEP